MNQGTHNRNIHSTRTQLLRANWIHPSLCVSQERAPKLMLHMHSTCTNLSNICKPTSHISLLSRTHMLKTFSADIYAIGRCCTQMYGFRNILGAQCKICLTCSWKNLFTRIKCTSGETRYVSFPYDSCRYRKCLPYVSEASSQCAMFT